MSAKVELDKAGQKLIDAADYIEKYGWWQGDLGCGPNGERCAGTAIQESEYESGAIFRLTKYLGLEHPYEIVDWNDHPARTKEQVIDVLRMAAYFKK